MKNARNSRERKWKVERDFQEKKKRLIFSEKGESWVDLGKGKGKQKVGDLEKSKKKKNRIEAANKFRVNSDTD